MKYELFDISETQKNLVVEIPSEMVDAEIARVAQEYSRTARVPGFRAGKVPIKVVRQRFREQMLNEVAHGLVPRAVDQALRELSLDPIDTPDIRDVVVEEGQPLKFTASFETGPPIDPGDYSSITVRRRVEVVEDDAVEQALERLRERAARFEPVEGRSAERGDTVVVDLERVPEFPAVASRGEGVLETFTALLTLTVEDLCRRYTMLQLPPGQTVDAWTKHAVEGMFGGKSPEAPAEEAEAAGVTPAAPAPEPPEKVEHLKVRVPTAEDLAREAAAGPEIRTPDALTESYAQASAELGFMVSELREARDLPRVRLGEVRQALELATVAPGKTDVEARLERILYP